MTKKNCKSCKFWTYEIANKPCYDAPRKFNAAFGNSWGTCTCENRNAVIDHCNSCERYESK